jgi:hypothetical protein
LAIARKSCTYCRHIGGSLATEKRCGQSNLHGIAVLTLDHENEQGIGSSNVPSNDKSETCRSNDLRSVSDLSTSRIQPVVHLRFLHPRRFTAPQAYPDRGRPEEPGRGRLRLAEAPGPRRRAGMPPVDRMLLAERRRAQIAAPSHSRVEVLPAHCPADRPGRAECTGVDGADSEARVMSAQVLAPMSGSLLARSGLVLDCQRIARARAVDFACLPLPPLLPCSPWLGSSSLTARIYQKSAAYQGSVSM